MCVSCTDIYAQIYGLWMKSHTSHTSNTAETSATRGKKLLRYVPRHFLFLFIFHYKGYMALPELIFLHSAVRWCQLWSVLLALPILCVDATEHRVPCVPPLRCQCKNPLLLSAHGVRFIAAEVPRTTSACYDRVYLFTYTSHFFVASTNTVGLSIPVSSRLCPFSVCIVAMLHRMCS